MPKAAPRDRRVESLILAEIDGLCATALRELAPGGMPADSSPFETISYFAAIQSARLPSNREFISSVYKKGAEEFMRLSTVSADRIKSLMDQYSRETGEPTNVSPESMVEAVRGNHLEVVVNELPFITHIFKTAEFLSEFLRTLTWEILVAPSERGFILCDDPVVIVPPKGVRHVGFGIPGSAKYFPLTRNLCLRFGDVGQTFRFRNVDRETVRLINQNIAANSTRFIMGPVRAQLETVVLRSASVEIDATPRYTFETTKQDDNGSLQKMTQNPRRYFYSGNSSQAP